MLRDRLVCGINEEQTQGRLLAESKLTLKRGLEIAQSLETAAQNVQALQGQAPVQPGTITHDISKLTGSRTCFRRGKGSHPPENTSLRRPNATSVVKWGILSQFVAVDLWIKPINRQRDGEASVVYKMIWTLSQQKSIHYLT